MQTTELFTPITSNNSELFREIEKPILVNQFSTGSNDVTIMLTDNYIVLCENSFSKIPTHYCHLTFAVKFETLFQTFTNIGE